MSHSMNEVFQYDGTASCCKCYAKATHVTKIDGEPRNTYCGFHVDTVNAIR